MQTKINECPAAMLEVEEYLFSMTAVKQARHLILAEGAAESLQEWDEKLLDHLRGMLRMHRFIVFTWLLGRGASLPVDLVADGTHPDVGFQYPDQPVKP